MESQQFDTLARRVVNASSRRGVVQAGVGALAAVALAAFGGGQLDEAEAKGNHHHRHHHKKKRKKNRRCPSTRPVTCGPGCCPSEFPQCCEDADEPNPDFAFECAPSTANCCPVSQGGGFCVGAESKCCPPTSQAPFGNCAEQAGTCCPSELGGFTCPAVEPVCCLNNPNDPFSGFCCPAGQSCGPNFSCVPAAGSTGTASVGVRQQNNERGHFSPR